jgi:hypothetical protein
MAVEFVESTRAQIMTVSAELAKQEFDAGMPIPTGVEGDVQMMTFTESLGFEQQATPMEYMAYIVILLENAGRTDARTIIHDRLNWFLSAYAGGAEPLAVAHFVDEQMPRP